MDEELFQIKAAFRLPVVVQWLFTVLILSITCVTRVRKCNKKQKKKVVNYSVDHATYLPFSLWWQSALFRKLDWNVWGLIYRSGMNTWMWSSAIFHTPPSSSAGILLPLPQKVAEGTVFHLNKHYGVMLNIIQPCAEWSDTPWNIFCADLRFLLK